MINRFIHEFPRKVNYLIFTFKKSGRHLNDFGNINNKCLTVSLNGSQRLLIARNTLKTVSNTNRLMMMMMKIRSVNNFIWHELCVQVKTGSVSSHSTGSSESKNSDWHWSSSVIRMNLEKLKHSHTSVSDSWMTALTENWSEITSH